MRKIGALIKRNVKLFFKDKGMFFTSLITPIIILVLYATFLAGIYKDSFLANLPQGIKLDNQLIDGLVGGQLTSSLLAVSCITVAFCSNFLMVQDKANGTVKDLRMSPVKPYELAIGYYLATLISTLIICLTALCVCCVYMAIVGWYLSIIDLLALVLDVILLVLFGTALSSVINFFLSSQGQISAVGSIISAGYGFICGAYMPISSFSKGLQTVMSFLPGTYGTSLVRNHALNGALTELANQGVPTEAVKGIQDAVDCNVYFFENQVGVPTEYLIVAVSVVILIAVYVILNAVKNKDK